MADVKREVRVLGQKITGLKAGDNVTLTFKKPKPRVDVAIAKKATQIAEDAMNLGRDAIRDLNRVMTMAQGGKPADAQKIFDTVRKSIDKIASEAPRAKEWADNAKNDADSALAEVKDAYNAAKDGAGVAATAIKNGSDGLLKAVDAVGAYMKELAGRE